MFNPKPKPVGALTANTPAKSNPGAFGRPTQGTTKHIDTKTLKQAVMGRSKLPVKKGTHSNVYLA